MTDNQVKVKIKPSEIPKLGVALKTQSGGGGGGVPQSYVDLHDALTLQQAKDYSDLGLSNKVDKVSGKELSTNDYTTTDKNKVDKVVITGNGTLYLSNDGTYKSSTGPKGDTGAQGEKGDSGTSLYTLEFTFNTTTSAPPASGQVRLDNSSQNLSTNLYISTQTATSVDVKNFLSLINKGQKIYIQDKDDSTKFQMFQITGDIVDNTTYYTVPVIWIKGGTALVAQRVELAIGQSGDYATVDYVDEAIQEAIIDSWEGAY